MPIDKGKSVLHALQRLLIIATLVYIGFGLLLYARQNTFIYHPTPVVDIKGLLSQVMTNDGESIRIQVLNTGQPKALIYFGGNAEAVARNAPTFKQVFSDHTIYLMNYRGYGGSTGQPREKALYADALALFDQVSSDHEGVSVIGRSLGSGVATYLASQREISRLVLVTPFDSIVQVAARQFPIYPVFLMLKDKYDSISRVPAIRASTLILIAEDDRIIDASHAHKLAAAFPPGQVSKRVLPNGGHNSISANPQYYELIRGFL